MNHVANGLPGPHGGAANGDVGSNLPRPQDYVSSQMISGVCFETRVNIILAMVSFS